MRTIKQTMAKRLGNSVKTRCRLAARPILPFLPDALTNRLPFLGRVCIHGPDDLRLRMNSYTAAGKDRIAIKLARHGFWSYEGETTRLFLPLVRTARCVIDIGANTGLFALLAGKANPSCRVFAFEPVPFIHAMLVANIRLNELGNVEAAACAVSDKNGETPFFITHTSGGVPKDSSACAGFRNNVEEVRVPTIRLDDFLQGKNLSGLDVLKIDAEATEAKVIAGAMHSIQSHRPFIVCEVLEHVEQGVIERAFASLRYRFHHITPGGLIERPCLTGSLAVDQRNHLFVPEEKLETLRAIADTAHIPIRAA